MIKQDDVGSWEDLDTDEIQKVIHALVAQLGLKIVRIIDDQWPYGHPDRITFVVEAR